MTRQQGLRARKKEQTRQRIAAVAAALFAERGYEAVSMVQVATAAEVSDQTVYNYFPAKQDLVLDLARQIRDGYSRAIRRRDQKETPAQVLQPLVAADVERYRTADLDEARGQFLAQSVESPVFRRFALEERERQVQVIADAIRATSREMPAIVAHAHAAALVGVIQVIHDEIGRQVLDRAEQGAAADLMQSSLQVGFVSLDHAFKGAR